MFNREELNLKTREELYSIIKHLNITNDKIKSENNLLKIVLNNFVKYYKYFDEISESFLSNKVLFARNQIKQWINLKTIQCSVTLNKLKLTENQLKGKTNLNVIFIGNFKSCYSQSNPYFIDNKIVEIQQSPLN